MIKVTNQIGKELRLSRFLNPDSKRTVMVAYAHGILMGPMKGMETNEEIKRQNETLKAADAVLMPMGFLPSCQKLFTGKNAPEMIALYDWQSISRSKSQLGYTEGAIEPVTTIDRVLASGAIGVMTYLFIGFDDPLREANEMRRNYEVNELCQKYGLIHIIEPRVVKSKETNEDGTMKLDLMKVHTRMAAELGADFIKVKYPDTPERLKELQDISPAPLLVAAVLRLRTTLRIRWQKPPLLQTQAVLYLEEMYTSPTIRKQRWNVSAELSIRNKNNHRQREEIV